MMDAALAKGSSSPRSDSFSAEARAILRLGWPLSLAQAGQALFGVVDTAVVGHLSAQAQGAVGLGNALFFGVSFLGMGIMMALEPLISQAIGAHQHARARALFWQGVWLSIIVSAVLSIPLFLSPLALPLFGVDRALAHETARYVWWR